MKLKLTVLGETGLRFFGKMSAANAHEIKNALAIINENAGLLEDLVKLEEQGVPLDLARLKRLADKIKQQVMRADEIAKSTNQFSHSVDQVHGPADLEQSLNLIKTMAMRFATQRHIGIEVVPGQCPVTLPVQPFMLLHLLWLCLNSAMASTNAEKTIRITFNRTDGACRIRFGPLSHLETATVEALANSVEAAALLHPMGGKIEADLERSDLVLSLMRNYRQEEERMAQE